MLVSGDASVSVFAVPKMDCPSEERMIRLALNSFHNIRALSFDLSNRRLTVVHDGEVEPITAKLTTLGLGASLQETSTADTGTVTAAISSATSDAQESGTLRWLLGINAIMFLAEMTVGLIAQSAGLIADSLDMFADAAVYGLALYAVGRSLRLQTRAAHVAGVLQLVLALGVLMEVGRRFLFGSEPESLVMMIVGFIALIANTVCLLLIFKHREGGVHMKASWIFSANDVLINLGVITAGALVAWTGSSYPDLIIGTIVGLIVLNGARRILALKA
ncbi:cation transporter [Pseudomonas saliphila]|uniref:cation transporter n=1 Tax=Pseudomonas saliphila TaxID=2586906 RepID=UPI0038B56FD6